MEITDAWYRNIEPCLPTQRGNVTFNNLHVLNAILYVAEQGGKWRGLPKRFVELHSRMPRYEAEKRKLYSFLEVAPCHTLA